MLLSLDVHRLEGPAASSQKVMMGMKIEVRYYSYFDSF